MIVNYPDEKKPLKDFCPGDPLVMVGELRDVCIVTDATRAKTGLLTGEEVDEDYLIVDLKTGGIEWRNGEALAHPVKAEVVVK